MTDNTSSDELSEVEHELELWPKHSDDLRASSCKTDDQAFVHWRPPNEARIEGFRKAAEVLADSLGPDASNQDMDTIIFPLVSCWRHYMELHIKHLAWQLQVLLGKDVQRRGGHKVDQLWSELLPLAKEANLGQEKSETSTVSRLIGQLSDLDPDSQNFRYAERRDGTQPLVNTQHIDVPKFHKVMLGVANYLLALETAIDIKTENGSQI